LPDLISKIKRDISTGAIVGRFLIYLFDTKIEFKLNLFKIFNRFLQACWRTERSLPQSWQFSWRFGHI